MRFQEELTRKSYTIFIAGIVRSGSTWSYNVAKAISFSFFKELEIESGWIGEYDFSVENFTRSLAEREKKVGILKFHGAKKIALDLCRKRLGKCIFTFRNPFDSIASASDIWKWSLDLSIEKIYIQTRGMEKWKEAGNSLFISFEDLSLSSCETINKMSKFLYGRTLEDSCVRMISKESSFSALKERASALEVDKLTFGKFERETLLHKNHNIYGNQRHAREKFSLKEQNKIFKKFEFCLDQGGNFRKDWLDLYS